MHELGVMLKVIGQIEEMAREEHFSHVTGIVLDIGELSTVLPFFIKEYFPLMIEDKPLFEGCELTIEETEGIGRCKECGQMYRIIETDGHCPVCNSFHKDVLSGRDFIIKEIQIPAEEEDPFPEPVDGLAS